MWNSAAVARMWCVATVRTDQPERDSVCSHSIAASADSGSSGRIDQRSAMVEPFAAAAFALKPGQMSDVVATQFGLHIILVTDRKQGKELKFEDAKDEVKEYVGDQLRDQLLNKLRTNAKVVINQPPAKTPPPKP